jgi:hypothetical protein
MHYKLNKNKKVVPCSFEKWAKNFCNISKTRVAEFENDNILVSTVFLGLDHSFLEAEMHVFETMVFENGSEVDCERSATYQEALKIHDELVQKYSRRTKLQSILQKLLQVFPILRKILHRKPYWQGLYNRKY